MESLFESASCMTELQRAFQAFTPEATGLSVEVVGHMLDDATLVHPVAGFEVRLVRPDGTATLYVSASYGELEVRPADATFAETATRQSFSVRLAGEYQWGETVFPTPEELAAALLGYMQYQLDSATEPVG